MLRNVVRLSETSHSCKGFEVVKCELILNSYEKVIKEMRLNYLGKILKIHISFVLRKVDHLKLSSGQGFLSYMLIYQVVIFLWPWKCPKKMLCSIVSSLFTKPTVLQNFFELWTLFLHLSWCPWLPVKPPLSSADCYCYS